MAGGERIIDADTGEVVLDSLGREQISSDGTCTGCACCWYEATICACSGAAPYQLFVPCHLVDDHPNGGVDVFFEHDGNCWSVNDSGDTFDEDDVAGEETINSFEGESDSCLDCCNDPPPTECASGDDCDEFANTLSVSITGVDAVDTKNSNACTLPTAYSGAISEGSPCSWGGPVTASPTDGGSAPCYCWVWNPDEGTPPGGARNPLITIACSVETIDGITAPYWLLDLTCDLARTSAPSCEAGTPFGYGTRTFNARYIRRRDGGGPIGGYTALWGQVTGFGGLVTIDAADLGTTVVS